MVRNIGQCQLSDNSRPVGRSGLGLGLGSHVMGRLGSGMRVSASFQIIPRSVARLRLRSETHVVGRLGSGMRVSVSFQIIPRPVGRLGLGSETHVVGRLGSGSRVGAGWLPPGYFW